MTDLSFSLMYIHFEGSYAAWSSVNCTWGLISLRGHFALCYFREIIKRNLENYRSLEKFCMARLELFIELFPLLAVFLIMVLFLWGN